MDQQEQTASVDAGQPAAPPARDDRPSILYCCPANILDITSGAALSQRTLLASLARRGYRSVALQATVFDSPQGGEHVMEAVKTHQDKQILRSNVLGIDNIIVRSSGVRRHQMTCGEQESYLRLFRMELRHRRPDMIFIWGGMLLEMTMMREAREAGIPVVFYLVNGGYKHKDCFHFASVIVTDTDATARLYKERLGLDCKVVGKFIDPGLIKHPARRSHAFTFINPSFEKGVNVFMPLAKLAARECPDLRFLVVESRGRWGNALKVLKFKPEDFPNVKIIGHQKDMRPVYGSTKALLVPSTWHESGARVIAEAQLNGIPVLASNTGGSSEMVGGGGLVFDLPEEVKEKKLVAASEDVVRPWLEALTRLWRDEAYYQDLCKKVEIEAQKHDIEYNTTRFIEAVAPAIEASKREFQERQKRQRPGAVVGLQDALARKNARMARRGGRAR